MKAELESQYMLMDEGNKAVTIVFRINILINNQLELLKRTPMLYPVNKRCAYVVYIQKEKLMIKLYLKINLIMIQYIRFLNTFKVKK